MAQAASGARLFGVAGPLRVVAPMVQQSELAFRLLCREHGANLAFTPMYYAKHFANPGKHGAAYRRDNDDTGDPAETGPLVVQFAGDHGDLLVEAGRRVQDAPNVKAVDLNFGCPQKIAKKGHYGAFLLQEPELCESLVRRLARDLTVPVTAKVRVLPEEAATLDLALRLVDAGAAMLTVHGRTKEQNKNHSGAADWRRIRAIVAHLERHGFGDVPVLANGGVETYADAEAMLETTGAAGVMSAEGLLEDPALFAPACGSDVGGFGPGFDHLAPLDVARRQVWMSREYLALARRHVPANPFPSTVVKGHLFKFLHRSFAAPANADLRHSLGAALEVDEMVGIVDEVERRYVELEAAGRGHEADIVGGSWYRRHWSALGVEKPCLAAPATTAARERQVANVAP